MKAADICQPSKFLEKVGISPFIDTKAHELFGSGRIICKGIAFTGKFRFNGIAKIFQVDRYIGEFYIYKNLFFLAALISNPIDYVSK